MAVSKKHLNNVIRMGKGWVSSDCQEISFDNQMKMKNLALGRRANQSRQGKILQFLVSSLGKNE